MSHSHKLSIAQTLVRRSRPLRWCLRRAAEKQTSRGVWPVLARVWNALLPFIPRFSLKATWPRLAVSQAFHRADYLKCIGAGTARPRCLDLGSDCIVGTCACVALLALVLCGCGTKELAGPPTPGIAAMNRGVSLMAQYQYEAAAESFQEALRLQPRSQEARLNLAIALFNRNRKEDVADSGRLIDEVLRQEPKHARALYFKAIMLQHVGRAQDAIPLLQQVLEQHPRDGVIWYLLGLCKQRTGQDSEVELLKAVEFRPYLYSAYYQLYQSALAPANKRNRQDSHPL